MTHFAAWHFLIQHSQDAPELVERGVDAGLPAFVFTALGAFVLIGASLLWWLIRRSRRR